MGSVLVLYIPAIHQGYINLFEKYKGRIDTLYVLDQGVIDNYPLAKREIRQLAPETAVQIALNLLDYFGTVESAGKAKLIELAKQSDTTIVTSTEYIADSIIKQYFSHFPQERIIQEPIFLRYDENTVKNARQEVQFKGTITKDKIHERLMSRAETAKGKSADYFLQVGAILVPKDHELIVSTNQRMPAPHQMHSVGDPRNYMPYGTESHIRTVLHAEQGLIAQAAREGVKIDGASLYVTTFPCPDCVNNLAEAGIKKLYFKDGYSHLSSEDVLKAYNIEVIKVI